LASLLFYALLHGLESRSGSLVETAGFLGHQKKGRQMVLHRQLIAFLGAQNKKPGGQSVGPHAELVPLVDPSKTWVCRSAGPGRQEDRARAPVEGTERGDAPSFDPSRCPSYDQAF